MTAVDPRRAAYAYLSGVVQGPCAPVNALVDAVGVEEAARAVREREMPASLQRRTEARRHIDTATADLEAIDSLGGRLLTPDDDEWPAWRMLCFTGAETERDGDCVAPLALWVLGDTSLLDATDRSVAIVGTRAASSYGEFVTTEIASEIATQGWTVVSGAAYGVDGTAHRAALGVDGRTVAVLACGVECPYPKGHSRLLREITRTGLVVSEYAPGTTPAKHRFLTRNRLVAALSDAVVVVEAGRRSGARNTAKWARRLGRPALAVPGAVTSVGSVGCHQMIRDGEARLVTTASDVIEEAGPLRLPLDEREPVERDTDALAGSQLLIYEALPAVGSRTPRELSEASGVEIASVRAALPTLEMAGFVGVGEEGWFRVRRRSRRPRHTIA